MRLIINDKIEARMLADFELERGECMTVLQGREMYAGAHQRARERVRVIDASVEELKKQMANPLRRGMLQEGVNPDNAKAYYEQVAQFQNKFNT